jgi:hypothetical protein
MQLKYVVLSGLIMSGAILTGCASNQCAQSQMIEEYYLKPTVGEDAARIDALEREIIAENNRKTELVKKDHIIDLKTKVAKEDLALEQDRTPLLKANLNLAVGKNDDALVKQAEAEFKANADEVERKQCVIEYLKVQKKANADEIALTDAKLAARVAEREYIRAKVARVNQDKQLGSPTKPEEEEERIDVQEYEDLMKTRIKEEKEAKKTYGESSGRLNATPSCGAYDEPEKTEQPQDQPKNGQPQKTEQPQNNGQSNTQQAQPQSVAQNTQQEQKGAEQKPVAQAEQKPAETKNTQQTEQKPAEQKPVAQNTQPVEQKSAETKNNAPQANEQAKASEQQPKVQQEKDTQPGVIGGMEQANVKQPCPCDPKAN